MSDRPPILSDDELRETIDLMATAIAGMTDRLDEHGKLLTRVDQRTVEARQAAFAAKAQTDPERYGGLIAETVDREVKDSLVAMAQIADRLKQQTDRTGEVLNTAAQDQRDDLRRVAERERKVDGLKRTLLGLGLGALLLAIAMTVLAPRVLASRETTCAIIGGTWIATSTGVPACVFFTP